MELKALKRLLKLPFSSTKLFGRFLCFLKINFFVHFLTMLNFLNAFNHPASSEEILLKNMYS